MKKLILLLLLLPTAPISPLTQQTQDRVFKGLLLGASPAIFTYAAWSYLKNGDFSPTTGKAVVAGLMGMTGATLGGLVPLATSSDALFQVARFSTGFTDPLLIKEEELTESALIQRAQSNIPRLPLMGAYALLESNMATLMGSSLLFYICQEQDPELRERCAQEILQLAGQSNRASSYRNLLQENEEFQRELVPNRNRRVTRPDQEEESPQALWQTYGASQHDLEHLHGYKRNFNN